MSSLSTYTPFESLLFAQSLATHEARPASFVTISQILRDNPFIRQNVNFNAERLSPEALEKLYTTLMQDGGFESGVGGALRSSGSDINGHRAESPGANGAKKRKISSPRAGGLVDSVSHTTLVPKLVSHLYATYKDLVTTEIRSEEKKYDGIKGEIEKLQREERAAPKLTADQSSAQQAPQVPDIVPTEAKPESIPAPEPMDVDVKEEKPVQQPAKEIAKPLVDDRMPGTEDRKLQGEQRKEAVDVEQQTAQVAAPQQPPQTTPGPHIPPAQPVEQPQNHFVDVQQRPQPTPQTAIGQQPLSLPVDGHANLTQRPSPGEARHMPSDSERDEAPKAPPIQQAPSFTPTPANISPSLPPAVPPDRTPHPQVMHTPAGSPVPPPTSTAGSVGKEGPSMATRAIAPQFPPGQPSFHQWNLNQPPQVPNPDISLYPTTPRPGQASTELPSKPSHPQQMAQVHTQKNQPSLNPPPSLPSTPGPVPAPVQSPLPNGQRLETPKEADQVRSFLESQSRSKRSSRPFAHTPGTRTPWRKSPPRLSIPDSPPSPVRPRPGDVSPISERAPSPVEVPESQPKKVEVRKRRSAERKTRKQSRERSTKSPDIDIKSAANAKADNNKSTTMSGRKARDGTPPSRGRPRSVVPRERKSPGHGKVKHEIPTTSADTLNDTEPEPRATRRPSGPAVPTPTDDQPAKGKLKRTRAASEALEVENLQSEPSRVDASHAPQYVLGARNFPRTGATIMNDVTTHKHASIFTKPLTERDAPGYRDLIYRPQDLKSIKSAIHQGSKSLTAAAESVSTPAADGGSPVLSAGTAPSKNTVLELPKTEDIIPPKGIVNSSQLEKELIRMFANAVMYNPVPRRGFGPAFPITSDHGSLREHNQTIYEAEEGGIIKDTQEMFDDVEQAVTRWRAAERTAEVAKKNVVSIRNGSASDVNVDGADDVK